MHKFVYDDAADILMWHYNRYMYTFTQILHVDNEIYVHTHGF